ncbi:hypothetical protein LTR84_008863 [Exophiala bonariae]|uniref:Uncharacterized protein n=1 Tax=Exophiala bonariae TaxID=1690606 RepID=A0AAV9MVR8_9EURO|nr:hypothetical protein LTR84_008863 [Exophiala bonariae]
MESQDDCVSSLANTISSPQTSTSHLSLVDEELSHVAVTNIKSEEGMVEIQRKRMPSSPQSGPYLSDGKLKWWLGQNFFSSAAQYNKIVEMLLVWTCRCYADYPHYEDVWLHSLRDMVNSIGLYWIDVREWSVQLLENPEAEREENHRVPEGREELVSCVQKFNAVYESYVIRDCLKPPPKQVGRKKRPRTESQDTDESGAHQSSDLPSQKVQETGTSGFNASRSSTRVKAAKTNRELAALYTKTRKQRFEQGEGKFTAEGFVKRPYIQDIIFAKDKEGSYIIPEERRPKLIDHYDAWKKQQEPGGAATYNWKGEARKRQALTLRRDDTGAFSSNRTAPLQQSELGFWAAVKAGLFKLNSDVVSEPDKILGMRIKEAHKTVATGIASIATVRHEKAVSDEQRRLGAVRIEQLEAKLADMEDELENTRLMARQYREEIQKLEAKLARYED